MLRICRCGTVPRGRRGSGARMRRSRSSASTFRSAARERTGVMRGVLHARECNYCGRGRVRKLIVVSARPLGAGSRELVFASIVRVRRTCMRAFMRGVAVRSGSQLRTCRPYFSRQLVGIVDLVHYIPKQTCPSESGPSVRAARPWCPLRRLGCYRRDP